MEEEEFAKRRRQLNQLENLYGKGSVKYQTALAKLEADIEAAVSGEGLGPGTSMWFSPMSIFLPAQAWHYNACIVDFLPLFGTNPAAGGPDPPHSVEQPTTEFKELKVAWGEAGVDVKDIKGHMIGREDACLQLLEVWWNCYMETLGRDQDM